MDFEGLLTAAKCPVSQTDLFQFAARPNRGSGEDVILLALCMTVPNY